MKRIECLQETDGFMERVTLWVEARGGRPHEVDLGPLEQTGTETLMGWGELDGEAAIVAFPGAPTFRVPLAKWHAMEAWANAACHDG